MQLESCDERCNHAWRHGSSFSLSLFFLELSLFLRQLPSLNNCSSSRKTMRITTLHPFPFLFLTCSSRAHRARITIDTLRKQHSALFVFLQYFYDATGQDEHSYFFAASPFFHRNQLYNLAIVLVNSLSQFEGLKLSIPPCLSFPLVRGLSF
jgi:hypothetical protein